MRLTFREKARKFVREKAGDRYRKYARAFEGYAQDKGGTEGYDNAPLYPAELPYDITCAGQCGAVSDRVEEDFFPLFRIQRYIILILCSGGSFIETLAVCL